MIEKLIDQIKQNQLLEQVIDLYTQMELTPIWGYEIEFYLNELIYYQDVEKQLGIALQKEKGQNQYEIGSDIFSDTQTLINSIHSTRNSLRNLGAELKPKPFKDDYGNSMHLHFNLLDQKGNNIFDQETYLHFAANGICQFINQTLVLLLTSKNDYQRLDAKFMAPTHVCYGNNNRSVAVRVPYNKPTRLEYRICSNNSDPYVAAFVILKSALIGINNKIDRHKKIFGNAFDKQYKLENIINNITDAQNSLLTEFILQDIKDFNI